MPNRIIRESWLESEAINSLSIHGERFFLRLCLKADDFGRYHANEQLLKSNLFPLKEDVRNTDIARWLAECEAAGLVRTFLHASKRYLEIPKFDQRTRALTSKFPPYDRQTSDMRQPSAHVVGDEVDVGDGGEFGARARASWPTVEQAKEMAVKLGMPESEGEAFWNHYQGQGWVSGGGIPITDWTAKLHSWKTKWERERVGKKPGAHDAPSINSIAQADSILKAIAEEIRRLEGKKRVFHGNAREGGVWKDDPDVLRKIEQLKARQNEVKQIKLGLNI